MPKNELVPVLTVDQLKAARLAASQRFFKLSPDTPSNILERADSNPVDAKGTQSTSPLNPSTSPRKYALLTPRGKALERPSTAPAKVTQPRP